MTNEEVATDIRTAFNPLWDAEYPNYPRFIDNEVKEINEAGVDAWIRFSFASAGNTYRAIGNSYTRDMAIIQIQIFTKIDTGDNLGRQIGDWLTETFRTLSISSVTFRAATLRRVGPDGKWYQMNLDAPYWSEHNA